VATPEIEAAVTPGDDGGGVGGAKYGSSEETAASERPVRGGGGGGGECRRGRVTAAGAGRARPEAVARLAAALVATDRIGGVTPAAKLGTGAGTATTGGVGTLLLLGGVALRSESVGAPTAGATPEPGGGGVGADAVTNAAVAAAVYAQGTTPSSSGSVDVATSLAWWQGAGDACGREAEAVLVKAGTRAPAAATHCARRCSSPYRERGGRMSAALIWVLAHRESMSLALLGLIHHSPPPLSISQPPSPADPHLVQQSLDQYPHGSAFVSLAGAACPPILLPWHGWVCPGGAHHRSTYNGTGAARDACSAGGVHGCEEAAGGRLRRRRQRFRGTAPSASASRSRSSRNHEARRPVRRVAAAIAAGQPWLWSRWRGYIFGDGRHCGLRRFHRRRE